MKKKHLLLIGCILITYLVFSFFSILAEKRKEIDLENLTFEYTVLPLSLKCSDCNEGDHYILDWIYTTDTDIWSIYYAAPAFIDNNELRIKEIIWEDKASSNVIVTLIIDYQSPVIARIYFFLNDPKGKYQGEYWNFQYAKEDIIPKDWDFVNGKADEEVVRCGDSSKNSCGGWFYQARYGQYYILIHPYLEMDTEAAIEIIDVITGDFENYLD